MQQARHDPPEPVQGGILPALGDDVDDGLCFVAGACRVFNLPEGIVDEVDHGFAVFKAQRNEVTHIGESLACGLVVVPDIC